MRASSPPPLEPEARPLSMLTAALWTILVLFLEVFIVGVTEALREGAYVDLVSRTGCGVLAYSLVFFGILRVHEPASSVRHVLALRPPTVTMMLLAVVVGAALALPVEWLAQILDARFPKTPEHQEALDRLYSVATVGKRAGLVISVIFIQPVLTELFFRGALFGPLRRTRRVEEVVVLTALLEALRSDTQHLLPLFFTMSLVFGWMRAATRSVVPSLMAHMTLTAIGTIPFVLERELPKPSWTWAAASTGTALLGLFAISWLGRRRELELDRGVAS